MTHFYSNGPLGAATRAALMTGRYQQRVAIEGTTDESAATADDELPVIGFSLPQLLKTRGYLTALIGKWHLGTSSTAGPNVHGFDYFFGFKGEHVDYYTHRNSDGRADLYENTSEVTAPGYMTDLITARAVRFIEANWRRRIFLEVAYSAPHWPYQPPGRSSTSPATTRHPQPDDSDTATRAEYVAMVEGADRGTGEMLRALERIGMSRNTLVIFTSDNGGEWLSRNAPLFNRKSTVWEGGIRVPAIVSWPGRVRAGAVSEQVGITMDLTASVLSAAQVNVPPGAKHEGMDLLPVLEGRALPVERTLFWRAGVAGQRQRAVRRGDWKLINDGNHVMLFDVVHDPGELQDLSSERQDIARLLHPLLAEWEARVDSIDGRIPEKTSSEPATTPQWRDETHGRDAGSDDERLFGQAEVKRLDLRITAADWARLVADMTEMAGAFGSDRGGIGMAPARSAACTGMVEGSACGFGVPTQAGACTLLAMAAGLSCTPLPGAGMPPGRGANARDDVEFLPRTPISIPVTVTFDQVAFHQVGLRLNGNSSLLNSWRSGVEKLPFRLDVDEFEGTHPEIRDQTVFGFRSLNLTNNSQDTSFLRAKVAGDLFREVGVPAAGTAFVRVYLDRGDASSYLGLYTLVEVPDEPMLVVQLGSGDGNLYKPAGTGARWTVFAPESFPKKTNQRDEDWADIEGAIAVLNESRASPEVWRMRLESRFEVNLFLRWLALNTIIGNADAYGGFSSHNYYLYGSPRHRDRLFFIPWDHDLALNTGPGGGAASGAGGTAALDLLHDGVNASWPLIRYLLDDPVYRAAYRRHVDELVTSVFDPARLRPRLEAEYARIAPFIVGADGEQPGRTFLNTPAQFTQAATSLVSYIQSRATAVQQALSVVAR